MAAGSATLVNVCCSSNYDDGAGPWLLSDPANSQRIGQWEEGELENRKWLSVLEAEEISGQERKINKEVSTVDSIQREFIAILGFYPFLFFVIENQIFT